MKHDWISTDTYRKCSNEECGLLHVGNLYLDKNGNSGKHTDKCPTIYSKQKIPMETAVVGSGVLGKDRIGWKGMQDR